MTDNHDDDRDEDFNNDPKKPEDDDDYVGYCKPPKKHWFKPGQSGNPKGRKKGSRGLKTDLKAELNSRVTITENGRTISLTKQQVIIKSLATKAAKGDVKAANSIVALTIQMHGIEDERIGKSQVSAADEAVLKDYLASIAGWSEPPPDWHSEPTNSSDADDIGQSSEDIPDGHFKPRIDDDDDGTDEGDDDSDVEDYGEEYDDDD
jgi:Family of unknown function (DUF5681)